MARTRIWTASPARPTSRPTRRRISRTRRVTSPGEVLVQLGRRRDLRHTERSGHLRDSFAGLDLSGGAVKVSAYGSGHQCNVPSFGGTTVNVRCYDVAGVLADTRYTVSVILNNYPLRSRVAGYAWADQPTVNRTMICRSPVARPSATNASPARAPSTTRTPSFSSVTSRK